MYSYGPPTHDRAKAGRPARTYIQQLCEDTGCCPEDLPRAMNDREEWRERVRDIRAGGTTWWWWWCHTTSMNFPDSLSLFLSLHSSISSIAFGRSSRQHPKSVQSCCRKVWAGRPTPSRPFAGIHWRRSLLSLSLHFQQCPARLVRLI